MGGAGFLVDGPVYVTGVASAGVDPVRILSLGAGVQSTTVLLMSIAGDLPPIEHAIFADTGWEPKAVYRHLRRLEEFALAAGVKVHRVSAGNLRADALDPDARFASMPLFTRGEDNTRGIVRRQCTKEYKVEPIERKVRELVGIKPRTRQTSVLVEQWYGISLDESQRMRDAPHRWVTNRYPLVDARMTRHDCSLWLARAGWSAPRSACIGCPYHSDHEWRNIRENPVEWADAVEFDVAIRKGSVARTGDELRGEAFLHRSCVPLDQVDLSTPEDRGQGSLFGDECAGVCGV